MTDFVEIDKALFKLINQALAYSWLDPVMVLVSDRLFWILIGVAFVTYAIWRRDVKLLNLALVVGLAVAIADGLSFFVLKQLFERMRPCWDSELTARLVSSSCVGQFGFPSNHTSNAVAVALVVWTKASRAIGVTVAIIAFTVGFSRVYLGMHFPGDIIGGIIFGLGFGHLALQLERVFYQISLWIKARR